jgi:hypothetical protein
MTILFIKNSLACHNEIIESVIIKYDDILNIAKINNIEIYIDCPPNSSFKQYIKEKYPNIKFTGINDYDYCICCTIYDQHFKYLNKDVKSNIKYISHEITARLKMNPNVYFLTPLVEKRFIYADILPFSENKKVSNVPIYIVQGNLNHNRRNLSLLTKILDQTYNHEFIIKLIGRGHLPEPLIKYKNKIILKDNLNFLDYHKEFLDGYCILPLITKQSHPQYYTKKLTSTISYALGYKLKSIIDKDLQKIYNLPDVEIFNDINDITTAFKKTLEDFYK